MSDGRSSEPGPGVSPAIDELALLSDRQGSALVSRSGTVAWACMPRFDSPSIFGSLLDPAAGHWSLSPSGDLGRSSRAYVPGTMVVRTEHSVPSGRVATYDALALGRGERGHEIGLRSPHLLLRVVQGIEGTVEMTHALRPRPEYGLTTPSWLEHGTGLRTSGGPLTAVLSLDPRANPGGGNPCDGSFVVAAGESRPFALQVASPWATAPSALDPEEIEAVLADTIEAWESWSALHVSYDGPYTDEVRLGGRLLQALTYAPTGAVIAAPTTSLPEQVGGERNWDYRYVWVRDASLTQQALWVAACPDEAGAFFRFLATSAGAGPEGGSALQILYGVGGERLVPEHTLDHLAGHLSSRPVRVGNGAWNQRQLDVYGELLAAAAQLTGQVESFDEVSRALLVGAADAAAEHWREPDEGIWEVRGARQHFLHSKLMCWVALDRALDLADRLGADLQRERWRSVAAEIRSVILDEGWNERVGAFTQVIGSDDLDASALMIPIVGFLPPEDPRVIATVEAIASGLTDERGFVYRYRSPDGLAGTEGTFTICTFWLAHALALTGEVERARSLFEAAAGCANDLGLLSEQIAPDGSPLGNFPQAFTHIGLINAAWAIGEQERESEPGDHGGVKPSAGQGLSLP